MTRTFHDDFLAELAALDDFLARRAGASALVQREDPDVRRLMESVAFFSARTREAANDQLRRSVLQLARGHLDDFLVPQPARALVQALPDGLLTDSIVLPAGTRLRVKNADGDVGLFSTMTDVTLRPLQIDLAELRLRPGGGFRVVIRIRARREVRDVPEPLVIHLSHLNDYRASLRFQDSLRHHLPAHGASVSYDVAPDPARTGLPCPVGFGGVPRAVGEPGAGSPIDRLRTFFHFPALELCLNVALPPPRLPWRQAWLCLDLDEDWPTELVFNKDVFRLFVIPIENLVRDAAVPIKSDGTRARFPIAPARGDAGLALHSVTGVFQELPSGRDPILPVHLATGVESYDLEQIAEDGSAFAPELVLRLPDAFARPRLIAVEARWYQPDFDRVAVGKLEVKLQTRHVPGVDLRLLGTVTPHQPSSLWREPAAMLQVLSRRASRVLSRQDLVSVMTWLGAGDDNHHAGVDAELLHVETREEPADLGRGGGIRQVYRITIADVDDDRVGLVDDYLRCVKTLLDAWSANPVRLEVFRRISGAARPLMIGSGT